LRCTVINPRGDDNRFDPGGGSGGGGSTCDGCYAGTSAMHECSTSGSRVFISCDNLGHCNNSTNLDSSAICGQNSCPPTYQGTLGCDPCQFNVSTQNCGATCWANSLSHYQCTCITPFTMGKS